MEKRTVAWVEEAGLLDGSAPRELITREETADMIQKALEYFFQSMIRALQNS